MGRMALVTVLPSFDVLFLSFRFYQISLFDIQCYSNGVYSILIFVSMKC